MLNYSHLHVLSRVANGSSKASSIFHGEQPAFNEKSIEIPRDRTKRGKNDHSKRLTSDSDVRVSKAESNQLISTKQDEEHHQRTGIYKRIT